MDQLDPPDPKEWERRRDWVEKNLDPDNGPPAAYMIGEHASALCIELQAVYCAGAFLTAIMLSASIVDAHIREDQDLGDARVGFKKIFELSGYADELEWLRARRNEIVHFGQDNEPRGTVDQQWGERGKHEQEAERSIRLVSKVLFEHPFV